MLQCEHEKGGIELIRSKKAVPGYTACLRCGDAGLWCLARGSCHRAEQGDPFMFGVCGHWIGNEREDRKSESPEEEGGHIAHPVALSPAGSGQARRMLTNIHLPNFLKGGIYQGKGKSVCVRD